MNREIHSLYSAWSAMRSAVVSATREYLACPEAPHARQTLDAMLIAEAAAKDAFEVAEAAALEIDAAIQSARDARRAAYLKNRGVDNV